MGQEGQGVTADGSVGVAWLVNVVEYNQQYTDVYINNSWRAGALLDQAVVMIIPHLGG